MTGVFQVLIFCLLALTWVEGGKNKDPLLPIYLFFFVFSVVLYEVGFCFSKICITFHYTQDFHSGEI